MVVISVLDMLKWVFFCCKRSLNRKLLIFLLLNKLKIFEGVKGNLRS